MTIGIYQTVVGFFVLDEAGNILNFYGYPKNKEKIAEKLFSLSQFSISSELEKLLKEYSDNKYITNSAYVKEFLRSKGIKCDLQIRSEVFSSIFPAIETLLLKNDYISKKEEFHNLKREVAIKLAKKLVAHSAQRLDKMVVHAILAMDDIDKTTNLFASRIREWYGIHFPEILKQVENHATLCKIITYAGVRSKITKELLQSMGFSKEKSEKIIKLSRESMGAEYSDEDLQPLQELAQRALDLYEQRERLEYWIEKQMRKIAPNMQAVVGSAIAARLIAIAGGLKELAMLPASTIQLLGAEKALFRALKTGANPPKHGVIYQMPELHSCPWWQRGNIARAIAGKLTIAARVDAFQGEYMGDKLRKEIERKIIEIKAKYKNPPEGKKKPKERKIPGRAKESKKSKHKKKLAKKQKSNRSKK